MKKPYYNLYQRSWMKIDCSIGDLLKLKLKFLKILRAINDEIQILKSELWK